ncbi:transmembrane protease serine 9-like [Uloborus diversus]|uniref:transmembrane protease serine 9-like n=1 Tax=Uloborus diversus TaxID=327109 RepID=UPI00240A2916|nr:transmembrane protease serine 9-like [Uloborus diversus]
MPDLRHSIKAKHFLRMSIKANDLSPKIVNGREAQPGELPWMVALYYNNQFRCSAFLISPRLVMTAAHCVEFENGIEPSSAFYGIAGNVDRLGTETRLEFSEVIPNPNFRQGTNEFDIAVMRIAEPLEFNDYMKSLCLPRSGRDFEFDYTEAMGWGLTATFGDEPSDVLRAVELAVEPRPLCQVFFALLMITITDRHLCATSTTRKGACFGDSGGPLVYDDPMSGSPVAIGVASFITPLGCARPLAPTVYSATAVFADWVAQAVGEDASELCFV